MQLSKRMEMLADMVTEGNVLADVGTDHGYIPIFLVETGKIPRAIAMDVRKGPLTRAKAHIAEAGLEPYIETRLSDGLAHLAPGEADTILIAGMGGPLLCRILKDHEQVADSAGELVLQPQSEIEETRAYLAEKGYRILREEMVLEEGKFYFMMRTEKGEPYVLSPAELSFGPLLLRKKDPVLYRYLQREEDQCRKLLQKLSGADGTDADRYSAPKEPLLPDPESPRIMLRRQQVEERLLLVDQAKAVFHT